MTSAPSLSSFGFEAVGQRLAVGVEDLASLSALSVRSWPLAKTMTDALVGIDLLDGADGVQRQQAAGQRISIAKRTNLPTTHGWYSS